MNSRAILAPAAAMAALLTVILVAAASSRPALADAPSVDVAPALAAPELSLGARRLPSPVLAVDVLGVLEARSPRVLEETLRPWANAIADQADSRRDAIRMAEVVSEETHFAPEVLDYRCNRGGYRSCDHGRAVGPFQVWDRSLIGASPEEQVRKAYARLKVDPYAWTTWNRARAEADAWLEEHAGPEPATDRVRVAKVPPEIVAAANAYLAEGHPIGSESDLEVDGKRWALVVEWHYHPNGFKGGPVGWHHGVTVFALKH